MSSRMTIYQTWAEVFCEGVGENSGAWYMVSRVSFHGMSCRISYRIGMFLLECDRPKTRCIKCTPMCASARVAPSNIVYSWYKYRSTGTGVLTTKVLLFR